LVPQLLDLAGVQPDNLKLDGANAMKKFMINSGLQEKLNRAISVDGGYNGTASKIIYHIDEIQGNIKHENHEG